MTGLSDEAVITNPNVYLIIDDAHKMYNIGSFWTSLTDTPCHVICFAKFDQNRLGTDLSMLITQDCTLRYETVMFSQDERNEFVEKFRKSDSGKNLLTEQVIDQIDQLTNGHPGLLNACLRQVLLTGFKVITIS